MELLILRIGSKENTWFVGICFEFDTQILPQKQVFFNFKEKIFQ